MDEITVAWVTTLCCGSVPTERVFGARRICVVSGFGVDESASDREAVERLFDALGEDEWTRLVGSAQGRVAYEIHRRFLVRFVQPGMRVLEIGAGPGRFTIPLAELGCRVVVSDISAVQLELNEQHVRASGAEHAVEDRLKLDICDLSCFEPGAFDAVVAFGGPLSYAFEAAPHALAECLRVAGPDGTVVASVMSLAGSARHFVDAFPPSIESIGVDGFSQFLNDGDQRVLTEAGAHSCRLFSWAALGQLVVHAGGRMVAGSASNWLSLGSPETMDHFESDPELWARFVDWEERFCREPGAIDGGTHLIFAASSAADG